MNIVKFDNCHEQSSFTIIYIKKWKELMTNNTAFY